MSRRMSVSMTLDAVRSQTKTVTRRHVDSWKTLKPGDRLTLIEKGMGLPKGAKQVVVCEVEVVDVRVESIGMVSALEVVREGFDPMAMTPWEFIRFWCRGHDVPVPLHRCQATAIPCRRIEWRYLSTPNGEGK